jgi:hypothetical protein
MQIFEKHLNFIDIYFGFVFFTTKQNVLEENQKIKMKLRPK